MQAEQRTNINIKEISNIASNQQQKIQMIPLHKIIDESSAQNLQMQEEKINQSLHQIPEIHHLDHKAQNYQESRIQKDQNDYNHQNGYNDYDDYNDYNDYNEDPYDIYDDYQIMRNLKSFKRISSDGNNQCQMEELIKYIQKENQKVMKITGFTKDWALIYFKACGWKMHLVQTFIDEKFTSHQMINYKPSQAQMYTQNRTCQICYNDTQLILKNICGDQFCSICWKGHLKEQMKVFYTDPFPPCMNEDCKLKTAPFILEQLSKNDQVFKQLYLRTICKSYALGSSKMKICKGREGFNCNQCFNVKNLFEMLQCLKCGNFLCGRCGEQYHHPSQCYDRSNWMKLIQNSTNFVKFLNLKVCPNPNCKQVVLKEIGCNSIVCKCKQIFCYICGQRWLPNHSTHGVCYREKQIKSLQQQINKKLENEKLYNLKLQKFKLQIQACEEQVRRINNIQVSLLKQQLVRQFKILSNQLDYLEPLKKKLVICLLIEKNFILSQYLTDSDIMKAELMNLSPLIKKSLDFFLQTLPNLHQTFSQEQNGRQRTEGIHKKQQNPQHKLAQSKIQMLEVMNKLDKYILR